MKLAREEGDRLCEIVLHRTPSMFQPLTPRVTDLCREMSEEKKRWLKEAVASMSKDEIALMREALQVITSHVLFKTLMYIFAFG